MLRLLIQLSRVLWQQMHREAAAYRCPQNVLFINYYIIYESEKFQRRAPSDDCSLMNLQPRLLLSFYELLGEKVTIKRLKCRVEEPSPKWYIYTAVTEFHGSLQKRKWNDFKSQRNGVCWEIVSLKMSKLILIKSQQHGCLNKTWILMVPVDILKWMEESSGSLNLHKEL